MTLVVYSYILKIMLAELTNRFLLRHNVYYGWVMAVIVFIITMAASSVSSIPQIILLPMTEEFGWQISDVANAIGLMFIVLACFAPFSGALMLKIGIRNVAIIAASLNIGGLLFTALAEKDLAFTIFYWCIDGFSGWNNRCWTGSHCCNPMVCKTTRTGGWSAHFCFCSWTVIVCPVDGMDYNNN